MTTTHLAGTIVALALTAAAGAGHAKPTEFTATLTGAAERPTAVTTQATGNAMFKIDEKNSTITYTVTVSNISDVTGAHLHIASAEKSGAPAAGLLATPPAAGPVNGTLCTGTITADHLMGSMTFKELVSKIRAGEAYVNVHTTANPGGEIRGQLTPKM